MKKTLSMILAIILVFSVVGCNKSSSTDKTQVKVIIPKGTPQLAMIDMIKNNPEFKGYEVSYEFPNSNDLLASYFLNQDAQIIIAPSNLGAVIYNKDVDYRVSGVLIWGSLYLVGNVKIDSISELAGKKIVSTGKGLTTDVLLNYLLKANNVDPIDIEYTSAATELIPLFLSGESEISLMPEPNLSLVLSKKPDTEIVMDFGVEWKKATGLDSSYPQASVFVNETFRKENTKFVKQFNEACEKATEWVNENPEKAGEYFSEISSGLPSIIASASVPRSNIDYITTEKAKDSLIKYYEILFEDNSSNIGGKMPDEEFYSVK